MHPNEVDMPEDTVATFVTRPGGARDEPSRQGAEATGHDRESYDRHGRRRATVVGRNVEAFSADEFPDDMIADLEAARYGVIAEE